MFKIAEKAHRSSNPVWNPGSVPAGILANPDSFPRSDPGLNRGLDPGSNPGSDPSANPGSYPNSKFRYPIALEHAVA